MRGRGKRIKEILPFDTLKCGNAFEYRRARCLVTEKENAAKNKRKSLMKYSQLHPELSTSRDSRTRTRSREGKQIRIKGKTTSRFRTSQCACFQYALDTLPGADWNAADSPE